MTPKIVGKNVKTLREKRGWTQEQLGERMNWKSAAKSRVSRIEAGKYDVRVSTVEQLAAALGCQPVDILTE